MLGINMGLWQNTAALSGGAPATPVTLDPTAGFNRSTGAVLSNGNLTVEGGAANRNFARATRAAATGATEFEVSLDALTNEFLISVEDGTTDFTSATTSLGPGDGNTKGSTFWWAAGNANAFIVGDGTSSGFQSFAFSASPTDKMTMELDRSANTIKFKKNGAQVGATVTGVVMTNWYAALGVTNFASQITMTANFAGPFAYGSNAAY